jgi:hypothetical protein
LMHERDYRRGAGGFLSDCRYLVNNLVHCVREADHGADSAPTKSCPLRAIQVYGRFSHSSRRRHFERLRCPSQGSRRRLLILLSCTPFTRISSSRMVPLPFTLHREMDGLELPRTCLTRFIALVTRVAESISFCIPGWKLPGWHETSTRIWKRRGS